MALINPITSMTSYSNKCINKEAAMSFLQVVGQMYYKEGNTGCTIHSIV